MMNIIEQIKFLGFFEVQFIPYSLYIARNSVESNTF